MTTRVATATGWVIRFIVSKIQPSFTSVYLSIFHFAWYSASKAYLILWRYAVVALFLKLCYNREYDIS